MSEELRGLGFYTDFATSMSTADDPEDLFYRDVEECEEEMQSEGGYIETSLMLQGQPLLSEDNDDWTVFLRSAEAITVKLTDISTSIIEPMDTEILADLKPVADFRGIIESCFSIADSNDLSVRMADPECSGDNVAIRDTVRIVVSEMLDALEHLNEFYFGRSIASETFVSIRSTQSLAHPLVLFDENEDFGNNIVETAEDKSTLANISADIERHARRMADLKVF